jgi:hypothetical protein
MSSTSDSGTGELRVDLPHWGAEVRLYDSVSRPVTTVYASGERNTAVLPALRAGIYEVEVTLAGRRHSQLATVVGGRSVRITADAAIMSAIPLPGAPGSHMEAAAELSHRPVNLGTVSSLLFVFIRTDGRAHRGSLARGLTLLDGDGYAVAELGDDVPQDRSEGWLAFTAGLPDGYYILRQGGRGARLRFQPLYLCAGWETHAFVAAPDGHADLRTCSLSMAPLGAGFDPGDETLPAAEVLLRGTSAAVVSGPRLRALTEAGTNPWLNILTAYAMIDLGFSALPDLPVGEHPDARAVRLDTTGEVEPFWQPPLLRTGLARVGAHAIRTERTVPLGSLTDVVLDDVVADSPWTAWWRLSRTPRATPGRQRVGEGPHLLNTRRSAPGSDAAFPEALVRKVYRLAPKLIGDAWRDVPAMLTMRTFATAGLDTLAHAVPLDSVRQLEDLLRPVAAEALSAVSGAPLARTTACLADLRLDRAKKASPAATRAVFEHALATFGGDEPAVERQVTALRTEADRLLLRTNDRAWRSSGGNPADTERLAARCLIVADRLLSLATYSALLDADGRLLYGNGALTQLLAPALPDSRQLWETALAAAPVGRSVIPAPDSTLVEVARSVLEDTSGDAGRLQLAVFRNAGTRTPDPDAVEALLPLLTQCTSFIAYGSAQLRGDRLRRLGTLLDELEGTVPQP